MSRRGNWNRALYKNRPQGLRGKDIGLYYRAKQINKSIKERDDFMVTIFTKFLSKYTISFYVNVLV